MPQKTNGVADFYIVLHPSDIDTFASYDSNCTLSSEHHCIFSSLYSCDQNSRQPSGAYFDNPKRNIRHGLLKIFLTIFTGISIGACIGKKLVVLLNKIDHFAQNDDIIEDFRNRVNNSRSRSEATLE